MFGMNEQASDTFRMQFPGAMTFIVHHQLEAELESLEKYALTGWEFKRREELRAWKRVYEDVMNPKPGG
jgi:hypothetical protein